MKKLKILLTGFAISMSAAALIVGGIIVLGPRPDAPRTWLHPDMTYNVVAASDGLLTCKSDPFELWPFGVIVGTSLMNWENLPSLSEGKRFKVTRRVGNYTPNARDYIVVLN